MRILQVIASLNPKAGGPVENLILQHKHLSHLGVQLEVVCCDSPTAPWLVHHPLSKIHALGPSKFGSFMYTPTLFGWLRTNHTRFDTVIVDGLWQYNSLAVWLALRGTQTPYFVYVHGMLDPWFKRAYPLKHLKKWLFWPWGGYPALKAAKAVLFTCEEERTRAKQSFWLYSAHEVIAPLGIEGPPINPKTDFRDLFFNIFPELRDKMNVLFLSRIQEKKGCDLLVEAFAKLSKTNPSLHLVMAGPDSTGWSTHLAKLAEEMGVNGKITWTGMLSGPMKWGAYAACDVFCLPSHQENFGIVVAEALACGLPVLISDKVNIWREINEDEAGIVDADTLEGTTASLGKWLEMDAGKRATMSEKARLCFAKRFDIRHTAPILLDVLTTHTRHAPQ